MCRNVRHSPPAEACLPEQTVVWTFKLKASSLVSMRAFPFLHRSYVKVRVKVK